MKSLRNPVYKPVALAVAALLLAQTAAAQTAAPEAPPAKTEAEAPKKLETVVVTSGSRIKRDNFSTPSPGADHPQ
jgi:hypothetical protein